MTVAQLRTIALLVFEADIGPTRSIQLTHYVNGKIRLRFMDNNENVLNYMVLKDGTSNYEPLGV